MGAYEHAKTGRATSNHKTVIGRICQDGRWKMSRNKVVFQDSETLSHYLLNWPQEVFDQHPSTTANPRMKSRLN